MSIRFENLPNRRAIIDRRLIAEQLLEIEADGKDSALLRKAASPLFRDALDLLYELKRIAAEAK